jgi:parallel beta-helix repeat protein
MVYRRRALLPLLLLPPLLGVLVVMSAERVQAGPQAITVTLADNLVNGVGNDDCFSEGCTLTEAITLANDTPGPSTITFDPQNAPYSIIPSDPGLPIINATDGITIDGAGGNVEIYGYEQAAGSALTFHSDPGEPLTDVSLKNIYVESFQEYAVAICASPGNACTDDVSNVEIENVSSNLNALGGLSIFGWALEDVTVKNFDVNSSNDQDAIGVMIDAELTFDSVTVRDSTITNVGNYGIIVQAHDGRGDGLQLINNDVSNVGTPIAVYADEELKDTEALDNTVAAVDGVSIQGFPITNLAVRNNTIVSSGTSADALFIQSNASGAVIEDNIIEGGRDGIWLHGDSGNVVRRNSVKFAAGDGITVSGPVLISRTTFFHNGQLGIDLPSDDDVDPGVTPNDIGDFDSFNDNPLLNFPVLTGKNDVGVTGTACGNCLIELFISDDDPSDHGEGQDFIADVTANGAGEFTVPICGVGLAAGTPLTATASFAGNTSEFSFNFAIPSQVGACPATPTPSVTSAPTESPSATGTPSATVTATPGPTIVRGDLDCNSQIDYLDALLALLFVQDLLAFAVECPSPGQSPNGVYSYGDVDCSGSVEPQDAVAILAYYAGVPLPPGDGCGNIGEPL